MKNKDNRIFNIAGIAIVLCFCAVNFLSAHNFYGNRYFILMIILYSFGIIGAISYLIFSILMAKHSTSPVQIAVSFLCLLQVPVLIFQSVNYYKDLFSGITELETEIYEIPVESYYEEYHDAPKEIAFFQNGCYYKFIVDDEMYSTL